MICAAVQWVSGDKGMIAEQRKTGVESLPQIPWSTNVCHFYRNTAELLGVAVPYIAAGLEAGESCVVIASMTYLSSMRSQLRQYSKNGLVEFVADRHWYREAMTHKLDGLWGTCVRRHAGAVQDRAAGLRVAVDLTWLKEAHWPEFRDFENVVKTQIQNSRLLLLTSYMLPKCSTDEVLDTICNHRYTLLKRKFSPEWDVLEAQHRTRE